MSLEQRETAGYVDIYGFSPAAGGWIIAGWVSRDWDSSDQEATAVLEFDSRQVSGAFTACIYEREDIKKVGQGLVAFIRSTDSQPSYLVDAMLQAGGRYFRLVAAQVGRLLDEPKVLDSCRDLIAAAPRSRNRAELLKLFGRTRYRGQDTLTDLRLPVFLELDALYLCPPHGVLLRGWFVDTFAQVSKLRLRSPGSTHSLDPTQWIRISRPDVANTLSERVGSVDSASGFLVYASPLPDPTEELFIEVETNSGLLLFKRVSAPVKAGLDAIREILSVFDLRYAELTRGFDVVAGPAIVSMNQQRLRSKPRISKIQFGPPPESPRASIIVPLYGRMDFVEYQLGLFYHTLAADHEIIYVLDDPGKARELEVLASSCQARFGRSFTVLSLSHNVGYGPANNIGLAHARAPYVCFLNSDVFPRTADWLEQLLVTAAEPGVGAVGALLVFEDGTIQHEGISYSPIAELGGWSFSLHANKGLMPASLEGTEEVDALTGACLVMRTETARELGGFDEGFVIGDFEDVDLCKRIQARGERCMLNRRAQLYHLERQSQGDHTVSWRSNLTLFNAWRFDRKWGHAAADA